MVLLCFDFIVYNFASVSYSVTLFRCYFVSISCFGVTLFRYFVSYGITLFRFASIWCFDFIWCYLVSFHRILLCFRYFHMVLLYLFHLVVSISSRCYFVSVSYGVTLFRFHMVLLCFHFIGHYFASVSSSGFDFIWCYFVSISLVLLCFDFIGYFFVVTIVTLFRFHLLLLCFDFIWCYFVSIS